MKKNFVITIARQYGCGGRTIGKLLADKLGIKYYDNELIKLAAENNGVSADFYKHFDEQASSKFASMFGYNIPASGYFMPLYDDMIINDKVFYTQANIIKQLATEPCIIVGRCGDYILKEKKNIVKVFLHADIDTRADRIVNKYGIKDKNIFKVIAKADKRRGQYYNTYTDQTWGDVGLYDIALDTSKLSIDEVVNILYQYLQSLPYGEK